MGYEFLNFTSVPPSSLPCYLKKKDKKHRVPNIIKLPTFLLPALSLATILNLDPQYCTITNPVKITSITLPIWYLVLSCHCTWSDLTQLIPVSLTCRYLLVSSKPILSWFSSHQLSLCIWFFPILPRHLWSVFSWLSSIYMYSFDEVGQPLLRVRPTILTRNLKSYLFVFSISNPLANPIVCNCKTHPQSSIFTTTVMKTLDKLSLVSTRNIVNKFLTGHLDLDCWSSTQKSKQFC